MTARINPFTFCPKRFLCPNMKITTLPDVYRTLVNLDQDNGKAFEIIMTKEEIEKARKCIDEMLRLGE